ncbi:hypothetical protein [Flavobacterium silvaticum]|uniref:Lipoprotein n=1 Tax=Flavobacterium silvaticum TaxID=1852020 RepID=A0A972JH55_9FLAO|nr:hypothetical protein [Flavobacterium silvaticum]NMH28886.1 hypothetical protein [Flavobacterium silvaticum]
MNRLLPYAFLFLLFSCGLKNTQEMLRSGDYDNAIDRAAYALSKNKDKKGNQEYIYILEDAYAKAVDRDNRQVQLLGKDANPRNLEELFNTYVQMNNRQEKIRPLLPLHKAQENRDAKFEFSDYSDQIANSKNALSKYLYDNTKALLLTKDKMNYRRAYEDLNYLNQINPNFRDVPQLMQQALQKGTDYVKVVSRNETRIMIPVQLERDLLDFSTYGLNDKWTVYQSNPQPNVEYDFSIGLNFREINISPERVNQTQRTFEKEIKVGQQKKIVRGHVVKDSLGHAVMIDVFKKVKAFVVEYEQYKASQVVAKVDYSDVRTNQLLQTFPVSSEFVFSNRYARYKGDKRAIDKDYLPFLNQRPLPFPTNEQMVYDTGEDLKAKLKDIIIRNKFRN